VATTTQSRVRWNSARTQERFIGYLFLVPIVVFFAVFVAYPFGRSVYYSLTDWSGFGKPRFVGLGNFSDLARDPVFWKALRNTLVFTVVTTALQTVVPLLVAVLLNGRWRGRVLVRTLLFLPSVVSLVVSAVLWRLIYDPNFGSLNRALHAVGLGGLAHAWLGDPTTVLPALMMVSLWQSLGLLMLIFLAGLQGIDPTLYEAARIDGAGGVQQFFHVTVPMLQKALFVVVTLNIINGLKTFDTIYVMTGGGPNRASEVLATYLYGLAFGSTVGGMPRLGYATAVSMVIFVLCMAGTVAQLWITRRSTR
jgi:ABC-type sugar transport system permease subunit